MPVTINDQTNITGNATVGDDLHVENNITCRGMNITDPYDSVLTMRTNAGYNNTICFADTADRCEGAIVYQQQGNVMAFFGANKQESMRLQSGTKLGLFNNEPTVELDMIGISRFDGEVNITSVTGSGKAVCVKADGNLGVCSDAVGAGGTCTCGWKLRQYKMNTLNIISYIGINLFNYGIGFATLTYVYCKVKGERLFKNGG